LGLNFIGVELGLSSLGLSWFGVEVTGNLLY
jgi:hypothetical protein